MTDLDKLRALITSFLDKDFIGIEMPWSTRRNLLISMDRSRLLCDEMERLRVANDLLQDRIAELEPEE